MKLTSGHFKRAKKYRTGPGGPFCSCCTKLRPEVMKVKVRRLLRRKDKITLPKEQNEE